MKHRTLFALLLAPVLFVPGHAQSLDKAKLDAFLDRLAEKNKAMGSLVIAKDGDLLYARAIGYAQIAGAEKKPLTAASRFRIGSITKMFTAAMIFQLVDEGKLQLTDSLDTFFPQIPNARKISLAHVLAHRSGIPNVRRGGDASSTTPISKEELLALIVKATPDFEPDTKYAYSNSGYFLLGLMLEKVTGKSYGENVAERVTAKLGLEGTYVATGAIDVNNNESLTYIHFGRDWRQVPETHPSILFGAGAIVSTPNDLARFIHALFELKIVSQESLARMKTLRDGEGMGMGMERFTFAGKIFYGHAGGADNYGAWLAYSPEEKLAVAYATNAKIYPVADIVSGVIDICYHRPFEIPTFDSLAVSAEVLDKYVGIYSSPEAPVKFTISREGMTLHFQPGTETSVPLQATSENKFKIEAARTELEFNAEKNQMTVKRRGGERVFTKEK